MITPLQTSVKGFEQEYSVNNDKLAKRDNLVCENVPGHQQFFISSLVVVVVVIMVVVVVVVVVVEVVVVYAVSS